METQPRAGFAGRLLARFVDAQPHELFALLIAFVYYFVVLTAYYILRPIRDEMAVAGGVDNIPWLWTGTLLGMLAAQPLFAVLVARFPRVRFVSYTYHFFALNLLLFFFLLRALPEGQGIWVGRTFYVWAAIFNLYVTSVFWALVVDVFGETQSRRLFGFIAAGGSVGAILGSTITATLAVRLTPAALLLVSAVLLEVAVIFVYLLSSAGEAVRARGAGGSGRVAPPASDAAPAGRPGEPVIGGSAWAGITRMLRSPYLLGICGFMLLFTIGSTFLYVQQARIVGITFADRALRTAFFAKVDLAVNVITLVGQIWLFSRLMRWLGMARMLALIPALSVIGFAALAAAPTIAVLVGFNVLRRAGNFAVARPTREVLYTVLPREDKYKAKSFVDTFVYRLGDQIGVWGEAALGALGLGIAGVSLVAVPLSFLWLLIAVWLGRQQRRLAAAGLRRAVAPDMAGAV